MSKHTRRASKKIEKSKKKSPSAHAPSSKLWEKLSGLLSKEEYFEGILNGAKAEQLNSSQVLLDSFKVATEMGLLLAAAKSHIGKSDLKKADLASLEVAYHKTCNKLDGIESQVAKLNAYYNASEIYENFSLLKSQTSKLADEYTVTLMADFGALKPDEQKDFLSKASELEQELTSMQKYFTLIPALTYWCIAAQKNIYQARLAQQDFSLFFHKLAEHYAQQETKETHESIKIKIVKSLIASGKGKLFIDKKHVTIKADDGFKHIFLMDANTKSAILGMFDNTNIKGVLESVAKHSDDVVVALFNVTYENAKPVAININIGDRRPEGNAIVFSPIRMYLPGGQVSAISSIQL